MVILYYLYLVAPNSLEFLFLKRGDTDTKASASKVTKAIKGLDEHTRPAHLQYAPWVAPYNPCQGEPHAHDPLGPLHLQGLPPWPHSLRWATFQLHNKYCPGSGTLTLTQATISEAPSACGTDLHSGSLEAPNLFL